MRSRLKLTKTGSALTIPAEGVARVVSQAPAAAFLRDMIHTAQLPGATAEDLLAAFRRHSSHVHVEPVDNDEFDWLVYFEDGVPDDFLLLHRHSTTALPAITAFPRRITKRSASDRADISAGFLQLTKSFFTSGTFEPFHSSVPLKAPQTAGRRSKEDASR